MRKIENIILVKPRIECIRKYSSRIAKIATGLFITCAVVAIPCWYVSHNNIYALFAAFALTVVGTIALTGSIYQWGIFLTIKEKKLSELCSVFFDGNFLQIAPYQILMPQLEQQELPTWISLRSFWRIADIKEIEHINRVITIKGKKDFVGCTYELIYLDPSELDMLVKEVRTKITS